MKIKPKIMLNASGIIFLVMMASMIAVSLLVTRQNRDASKDLLNNAFKIIRSEIASLRDELHTDGNHMASVNDMGTKIQFFGEEKGGGGEMATVTYREAATSIYNAVLSSKIQKVHVYDKDGDLGIFVYKDGDATVMGFPDVVGQDLVHVARMQNDQKPDLESWRKTAMPGAVKSHLTRNTADTIEIQVKNNRVWLVAFLPSMAEVFNTSTGDFEDGRVGTLVAELPLGESFARRIADLSNTQINIFTADGLSAGTIDGYSRLDLDRLNDPEKAANWQLADKQHRFFRDTEIGEKDYFQSILPIFEEGDGQCDAAIAALLSKEIARQNTSEMLRLLMLITFLGIVFVLPATYVFASSISRPILKVKDFAAQLRKGDLSVELPQRKDEIGEMGEALNIVVDELKQKAEVANAIAQGDLTREVHEASELDILGRALQKMLNAINAIMAELHSAADQVDAGSTQVSDSSQYLSDGASKQAASIQQINSSMMAIKSQTRNNADNAGQANQLATSASGASGEGVRQMEQMITAMNEISESGREIEKIVKVIDDIAFQTNLLALNASVEAARAGKHGKGFAVVAQEVRNLAARSAKSAHETSQLITETINKVTNGSEISQRTNESLIQINEKITSVSDLVAGIAKASNDQAEGISQISNGMSQIDEVTQQNTANAEETSAAASELSTQASHVRLLINRFKLKQKEIDYEKLDYEPTD
ncbi:MAG: methyl-accepting chemotaxis protein [Thermodesulfobacteriota bacterium]|nr:methyl-accepting chemotaxis protein [Thermodesulfobacteriota bacterium]